MRAEQESLRIEISELQAALARPPRWGRSSLTRYPIQTNSPEERAQIDAITSGKKRDIQTLSEALSRYLAEHQGQFPSGIEQLDSFLRRDNLSLSGTNQFEIVYTGTVDELTNFPLRSVAMIRERQPWRSPAGDWMRVYGMYGGRTIFAGWSKTVSAADNFSAFEAEYVVSPPAPNSISQ